MLFFHARIFKGKINRQKVVIYLCILINKDDNLSNKWAEISQAEPSDREFKKQYH